MSRLDRHIAGVQNKLALDRFFYGLAVAVLILAGTALVAIGINLLVQWHLPRQMTTLGIGVGAAVLSAVAFAMSRRPSRHEAAVAIDDVLKLKEKFSTALYARSLADPFSAAAVRDAEVTADRVELHKKFSLSFPKPAYIAVALAILAFGLSQIKPMDLLGQEAKKKQQIAQTKKVQDAKKVVEQALATVNAYPKSVANEDSVKLAKRDLEALLKQPAMDPAAANRTAMKALDDTSKAIAQKIKENKDFAKQNDQSAFRANLPPAEEKGPVAEAQRAMARGDMAQAVDEIQKAVENFNKMDEKEQEKAAQQMANLAQQLQQMANNPQAQQQMQQQLQKAGMNPQQAQQLAQAAQQAAQGNPQAKQQLQQMQQQAMQGMNAQQQQQMQQMMQNMQAQAANQQQAQQMGQQAQQMAQAMQQAQQGQNAQQGQQAKQGQAANQQQANAQQQMQQNMQAMQAMAADMKQLQAAQQAANQAAQQAANNINGNQPGGQGQNQQGQQQNQQMANNQPKGNWQPGNPNQQGQGMGQAGIGNGGRANKSPAPFGVKTEMSPSQDKEDGKVLASSFIKAGSVKGESKQELSTVAASALKDATDEVEQDRVSRQAQQVVKEYFETMQKGE